MVTAALPSLVVKGMRFFAIFQPGFNAHTGWLLTF